MNARPRLIAVALPAHVVYGVLAALALSLTASLCGAVALLIHLSKGCS